VRFLAFPFALVAVVLSLALTAPPAEADTTCVYDVDHGTAEFQPFPETWQDPDCPECAPLRLLRIDENGVANAHLFFTPGSPAAAPPRRGTKTRTRPASSI
jgi:hypothetical protein